MQKHTKVYLEHFGYDTSSFIPCELCGKRGNQIHHIEPRSAFGSKRKHLQDDISNLASLCFECHERAHGPECREVKAILKEVAKNRI